MYRFMKDQTRMKNNFSLAAGMWRGSYLNGVYAKQENWQI